MKLRSVAAVVLLAVLAAVGCSKPPDEERIRASIDSMVEAVTEKRPGDFMDYLATDFAGPADAPRRMDVERLLRYHQIRNKNIGVLLRLVEVELHGDRATASFNVLLTGSESWLPERGKDYAFVTGWRLDDGDWKIIYARTE